MHLRPLYRYCDKENLTCGKGEPKLVGDATAGSAGVESMLDIETVTAVASNGEEWPAFSFHVSHSAPPLVQVTGVAGNVEAEFWGYAGRSPDNPANEPFMK